MSILDETYVESVDADYMKKTLLREAFNNLDFTGIMFVGSGEELPNPYEFNPGALFSLIKGDDRRAYIVVETPIEKAWLELSEPAGIMGEPLKYANEII